MKARLEEIDSQAFGRNVLRLDEPEAGPGFAEFEAEYLAAWEPVYVYVKVPAEELSLIHHFEDQGFRFMEFQLRMSRRLPRKTFDTSAFDGALEMRLLGPEDDLEPVLKLADDIFTIDRLYMDPLLPDKSLAKRRYRLFITKSWQAEDEEVLGFYDRRDGGLVSFHTHKYLGDHLVLTFLGGHAPAFQGSGLVWGGSLLFFNHWINRDIKRVRTHISMANYRIMEAEYKGFDYRPEQSFAVLRKIYP